MSCFYCNPKRKVRMIVPDHFNLTKERKTEREETKHQRKKTTSTNYEKLNIHNCKLRALCE